MDMVRVSVACFLFYCQIMSLEMFTNMDETGVYFRAHPNNTLGKVKGCNLALAVNLTGIDKLKFLVIYTSKQP
jgi:hypothetical protein